MRNREKFQSGDINRRFRATLFRDVYKRQAVPHLVKQLMHTSKPILMIPGCFLGGSVCCLFCDLLARTMFAPTELSISTVTAFFGAPVVIFILLRRQKERN